MVLDLSGGETRRKTPLLTGRVRDQNQRSHGGIAPHEWDKKHRGD